MNNKLLTQLKILKLTHLSPNFSELARLYGVDRRTVKSTKAKGLKPKKCMKGHPRFETLPGVWQKLT